MKKSTEDLRDKKYLKIAMLGHKRVPSREGGIEIVVEELSTRMVQRGNQVTCYNRKGHHVSGSEYDYNLNNNTNYYKNVKLISVATIDKKGLAAMTASVSAVFMATFGKYDVIHFHAEGPCAMLWFSHLFGKRCIVTVHGLDWNREKWKSGFGSKYIKFGEKIAAKYGDEIIVLSENVSKYFKETYGRDTYFIPNGVNQPKVREAAKISENFGLHKDEYILFLGRIVPEKGIQYLVEAFTKVKTNKKLVIAGGSSDSEDFINNLKLLAVGDERIVFTGFIQGQLLEELYSNSYVYTLPSDLEGMPLSLLEAMSYGNCCLVSDIAELTELVEDKAVVFKKSNVTDLTEKLQMLCDKPELVEKYKSEVASYIIKEYNWDNIVDYTLTLYRGMQLESDLYSKRDYEVQR